jgi:dTDP-glucose pyrophosphorylase/CBS domain-containing protein
MVSGVARPPRHDLDALVVPPHASLLEALRILDRSALAIVLVVDAARVLLGTLTDGDVRRALLRGASLTDSIEGAFNPRFTSVDPRADRNEVLDLMRARKLSQIPIVEPDGRLIGLHTLYDVVGAASRPNAAVVMAGGRGQRLMPLTSDTPKPMLPVAGRPILERIVLQLVGQGIRDVFISVHYLPDVIQQHFGDGERFGCRIRYLRETEPLGTGGALSLLPAPPNHPVLVMNGDLVTQLEVGTLLERHAERAAAISVAVRRYFHRVPFGCVTLDGDRIVALQEKPRLEQVINAGVYVVSPDVVAAIPKNTAVSMPELVEQALARRQTVLASEIDGEWIDVGQHDQLLRARGEV